MKLFLLLLSLQSAHAVDHSINTSTPTIIWVFSTLADKNPTVQTSLVTNRHELFRLYYKDFPDYVHVTRSASLPRIEQELKTKNLACYPGSSEAERRRSFAYLTPQYIQPSPRLVIRKEIAEKFLKADLKSVSLQEVVDNHNLTGVRGEDRSFGPEIDKILSSKTAHIKTLTLDTFGPGALETLEHKKADYTIEYGFIFDSFQANNPRYKNIISLPINDIPPFIVQYLACSKTADGFAVIKRADEIIRKNVAKASYWEGFVASIPMKERASFQKEIDKFIGNRSKAVQIIE